MIIDPFIFATPFVNTKSLLFDGVDDYIDFGTTATYTDVTISFWIKRSVVVGHQVLFYATASNNIFQSQIQILSSTNYIQYNNWNGFTAVTGNVCDGAWHHVIIVNDVTAQEVRSYVDGVLYTTLSNPFIHTSNVLELFGTHNASSHFITGGFDELSIFDSVLSPSDITAIYNSGTPTDLTSLSPINWWRMGDGDTYPTIIDHGSGGNNGTMTNMSISDIVTDVP